MNVLHVTLGFYPAVAWGGPVKIVYQNARELIRRGHTVTVYCTNLLNKREKIASGTFEREIDGIRVVYLNAWHWPDWPGTLGPVWLPDIGKRLEGEIDGFDVVHVNGYRNPMLIPVALIAHRHNKPVVMQPHGAIPVIVNSFLVKHVYDRLLGRMETAHIGALIAGQESEKQQALSIGVPEQRIVVIPNGMDLSEQAALPARGIFRRRLGIRDDQPLILFLGRINRKKGVDMLVEAFARLSVLDCRLVIAGPDDGQLAQVQALVVERGLSERVIFTGLLEGSEVLAAHQDADLFVLPCRTDTFPMTIIEACFTNTPMVVTEGCEMAHLINGRVADIVPFDAAACASAIDRLLVDHERYARYQANCPQVMADTFSLSAVGDQLEALYRQVIAESRAK